MVAMHDGSCGLGADDEESLRRSERWFKTIVCTASMVLAIFFFAVGALNEEVVPRMSVDVDAMKGLNATAVAAGRTVSPVVNLTAKVENQRTLAAWCSSGGQAVVSYAGVSLAWARVPAFCVPIKGAAELTVAASGTGVGLSDELRSRFVTEWNMGAARVMAVIKLFHDRNGWPGMPGYHGVSFVSREVPLLGSG